jgi:geranylgeranyl transferase type-1 subunit beta
MLLTDSLQLVGHPNLISLEAIRRFLFEQTQHSIGGFGKVPGDPPGISYSVLTDSVCAD